MQEERAQSVHKVEISGVIYCVESHYSTGGSIVEILRKTAAEAIRASEDLS